MAIITGIEVNLENHELDIKRIRESFPSGFLPDRSSPEERKRMQEWEDLPFEKKFPHFDLVHKITSEIFKGFDRDFIRK